MSRSILLSLYESLMSWSLSSVMPRISSRRSGLFSRMSRVPTPNRATILAAVFSPMPFIRPEPR